MNHSCCLIFGLHIIIAQGVLEKKDVHCLTAHVRVEILHALKDREVRRTKRSKKRLGVFRVNYSTGSSAF